MILGLSQWVHVPFLLPKEVDRHSELTDTDPVYDHMLDWHVISQALQRGGLHPILNPGRWSVWCQDLTVGFLIWFTFDMDPGSEREEGMFVD